MSYSDPPFWTLLDCDGDIGLRILRSDIELNGLDRQSRGRTNDKQFKTKNAISVNSMLTRDKKRSLLGRPMSVVDMAASYDDDYKR